MNSFTFCAGGFRDGAHFCRNILFNIQLRQRNRQANGMAQRSNGFDFFDRRVFQHQLRQRTESDLLTVIIVVRIRNRR